MARDALQSDLPQERTPPRGVLFPKLCILSLSLSAPFGACACARAHRQVLGMGVVKQMTVTITCDHRIISGSDAAIFLKDLAAAIESPACLK